MEEPNRTGWNERVVETYAALSRLTERLEAERSPRRRHTPTVSVAVTHYNHGAFLPGVLNSVVAQDRAPDEVFVIDDGSTSRESLEVFAEQEARYPNWTFLRQTNAGPGGARNACLAKATGDYFLPFDADNLARPNLVGALVGAVQRDPDLAAASCHYLAFSTSRDLERQRYVFRFAPLGGPLISVCDGNVLGDTCSLFRADALRDAGGFEAERWSPFEDLETFVKLISRGLRIQVVPAVLFDYRIGVGGRMDTLIADRATLFRHRRRMLDAFIATAPLERADRVELWESALAFAQVSANHFGGRSARRIRTPAQRVRDLRNLVASQRMRGERGDAIALAVASAVLRRR